MVRGSLALSGFLLLASFVSAENPGSNTRPRTSDLGLKIGVLSTGPLNAITDVAGVKVGHTTIISGDNIRTGVTAVLPHSGNLFREKVPAAVFVGNGFGKLIGSTQIDELGEIETPILLTNTESVPLVADAVTTYVLTLPGNEAVLSVNPVVGETNDGYLNDIRGRHITPEDVFAAIKKAKSGSVEEGNVGAGTGTVAFWLERRNRNFIPKTDAEPGWVHGRCPGADEFWRRSHHRWRSCWTGTRPVLPA
jgi:D-aminopeptidase